nr:hypothetical protein Iba_chr09aCG9970 [Ipomoea batatas]
MDVPALAEPVDEQCRLLRMALYVRRHSSVGWLGRGDDASRWTDSGRYVVIVDLRVGGCTAPQQLNVMCTCSHSLTARGPEYYRASTCEMQCCPADCRRRRRCLGAEVRGEPKLRGSSACELPFREQAKWAACVMIRQDDGHDDDRPGRKIHGRLIQSDAPRSSSLADLTAVDTSRDVKPMYHLCPAVVPYYYRTDAYTECGARFWVYELTRQSATSPPDRARTFRQCRAEYRPCSVRSDQRLIANIGSSLQCARCDVPSQWLMRNQLCMHSGTLSTPLYGVDLRLVSKLVQTEVSRAMAVATRALAKRLALCVVLDDLNSSQNVESLNCEVSWFFTAAMLSPALLQLWPC